MTHQYPDILDDKEIEKYTAKVKVCKLFTPWIQTYLGVKYVRNKPSDYGTFTSKYTDAYKYDGKTLFDKTPVMFIQDTYYLKMAKSRDYYMYDFTETSQLDELDKKFITDYKSFEKIEIPGLYGSDSGSLYFRPSLDEAIGLVHRQVKNLDDIERMYITTNSCDSKDWWDNYHQRHKGITIVYIKRK